MASLRTYAFCVLASLAFVAPVNGAEATGAPPGAGGEGEITVAEDLTIDTQATISYSNPDLAGTTVTIDIDDGVQGGQTDTVQIQLDESGKGSTTWSVPQWLMITKFNAPDAHEEVSMLL